MGFTDLNKPKKIGGADTVHIEGPVGTFGEVLVANLGPIAQGDFVHNINPQTFTTSSFSGGTVSSAEGQAVLESGTNAAGSATVQLRRRLEYRPGEGSMMRATAVFEGGFAGNAQFVGAGSAECGYFIGYFNGNFGVLHSETGAREVRKLTVTTGAGTETVTVTLDGNDIDVDVVGGGSVEQTAYQLSLADYSQVGNGGWLADAVSGSVYFIAARSNATSTGAYAVAGTAIVGSFTREQVGEAQTNTFVTSGSFNKDKLDGTGPSGVTLDPTKGNVYQIAYQYLGYGAAHFSIEDPSTGHPILMHVLENANARTTPVLKDPNLSVLATSANIGGTTSRTLKTASMAAFTEGPVAKLDPKFARSWSFSGINSATYVPLAIMKANRFYDGQSSFGEFDILRINASNEVNNKTLTVGFFLDAEIVGDINFQYVSETTSIVSIAALDPSTNTIANVANLSPFHEMIVGPETGISENLDELEFVFGPGKGFVIAIKTTASLSGQVGINWFEQQ